MHAVQWLSFQSGCGTKVVVRVLEDSQTGAGGAPND